MPKRRKRNKSNKDDTASNSSDNLCPHSYSLRSHKKVSEEPFSREAARPTLSHKVTDLKISENQEITVNPGDNAENSGTIVKRYEKGTLTISRANNVISKSTHDVSRNKSQYIQVNGDSKRKYDIQTNKANDVPSQDAIAVVKCETGDLAKENRNLPKNRVLENAKSNNCEGPSAKRHKNVNSNTCDNKIIDTPKISGNSLMSVTPPVIQVAEFDNKNKIQNQVIRNNSDTTTSSSKSLIINENLSLSNTQKSEYDGDTKNILGQHSNNDQVSGNSVALKSDPLEISATINTSNSKSDFLINETKNSVGGNKIQKQITRNNTYHYSNSYFTNSNYANSNYANSNYDNSNYDNSNYDNSNYDNSNFTSFNYSRSCYNNSNYVNSYYGSFHYANPHYPKSNYGNSRYAKPNYINFHYANSYHSNSHHADFYPTFSANQNRIHANSSFSRNGQVSMNNNISAPNTIANNLCQSVTGAKPNDQDIVLKPFDSEPTLSVAGPNTIFTHNSAIKHAQTCCPLPVDGQKPEASDSNNEIEYLQTVNKTEKLVDVVNLEQLVKSPEVDQVNSPQSEPENDEFIEYLYTLNKTEKLEDVVDLEQIGKSPEVSQVNSSQSAPQNEEPIEYLYTVNKAEKLVDVVDLEQLGKSPKGDLLQSEPQNGKPPVFSLKTINLQPREPMMKRFKNNWTDLSNTTKSATRFGSENESATVATSKNKGTNKRKRERSTVICSACKTDYDIIESNNDFMYTGHCGHLMYCRSCLRENRSQKCTICYQSIQYFMKIII